jgi:hypothetical protein
MAIKCQIVQHEKINWRFRTEITPEALSLLMEAIDNPPKLTQTINDPFTVQAFGRFDGNKHHNHWIRARTQLKIESSELEAVHSISKHSTTWKELVRHITYTLK